MRSSFARIYNLPQIMETCVSFPRSLTVAYGCSRVVRVSEKYDKLIFGLEKLVVLHPLYTLHPHLIRQQNVPQNLVLIVKTPTLHKPNKANVKTLSTPLQRLSALLENLKLLLFTAFEASPKTKLSSWNPKPQTPKTLNPEAFQSPYTLSEILTPNLQPWSANRIL